MSQQIGKMFDDTRLGNMRRYWFVGGLGAGILGVGAIQHWGMKFPDVALILLGGFLMFAVLEVKKRRDWDV